MQRGAIMFKNFIKAGNKYTQIGEAVPAPYIRKSFHVDFFAEKAALKICTPGFYELYINGKNITKGFLAPYISNPSEVLFYDEYDISKYLVKGENVVGFILGNGFANQTVASWEFSKAEFRAPLSVCAVLEAEGEGKSLKMETDETFKTHPSPIIYDMYRYGTHYDANREIEAWCKAGFDDSGWTNALAAPAPAGDILPCTAHPMKTQYTLSPVSIEKVEDFCYLKTSFYDGKDIESTRVKEGYLYDFGKSRAGVCKLKIKGERGQKITLRHTERLAEDKTFNFNCIYTFKDDYENYIDLYQTDVYILKGGEEEIYVPPFTYHGFRYVLVEGLLPEQATEDLLTYEVFNSDIKKRIDFECSDDTVNTLFDMGIAADMSNFHYFPTDCPHREKNGWTGDAAVSAAHMLMSFDCGESLRQWLCSMRYAQRENGIIPGIVPTVGWGCKGDYGPTWDAACIELPYCIYKYDGREDVVLENADMMYKYLKYISSVRDENGLLPVGLGDWCQPGSGNVNISAPKRLTNSATVYDLAIKSAFMFEKCGRLEEMKFAQNLAAEMKTAIRKNLIDFESMTAEGACQTSQALMLSVGLFEEDEYEKAYKRLIELIYEKDCHLDCGVVGVRHIFEVLMNGGDAPLALKMICREDGPSYGAMIKIGATALCEAFEENRVQESQNHHFFGDILRVFVKSLAGLEINPNMNNINEVAFSPIVVENMNFAKAEYNCSKGIIKSGWERSGEKVRMYIELPDGIEGKAKICGSEKELKAGLNEFLV